MKEEKSIFSGADSYTVKITKPLKYFDIEDAKLNIEITDKMATVEGNFYGGGSGVEVRIKMTSDYHKYGGGNAVSNCIEIENSYGCQFFEIEQKPDEDFKDDLKSFKFSFGGAWEFEAIVDGLKIVLETMQEIAKGKFKC